MTLRTIINLILIRLPSGSPFLVLLVGLVSATIGRAEPFVLFDVTFPFTKADADNATPSKLHYYVKGDKLNAACELGRHTTFCASIPQPPQRDHRWSLSFAHDGFIAHRRRQYSDYRSARSEILQAPK